ncbi:hypothetical protein MRX96_019862 [Rhipicephalus microplus]
MSSYDDVSGGVERPERDKGRGDKTQREASYIRLLLPAAQYNCWPSSSERASLSAWIVPRTYPSLASVLFRRLAAISALISWDPLTHCVMRHWSV